MGVQGLQVDCISPDARKGLQVVVWLDLSPVAKMLESRSPSVKRLGCRFRAFGLLWASGSVFWEWDFGSRDGVQEVRSTLANFRPCHA